MEKINYPDIDREYYYNGGKYQVMTIAIHTETGEPHVVHKSLSFGTIYAIPISSWNKLIKNKEIL